MNKLGGFGPVYVINLPRRKDRREHMEKLFNEYEVSNYTFIDAFDGKEDILEYIDSKSIIGKSTRQVEIATTMSHVKAINYWLNNSDSDYAIFCEDDLSFETVKYWNWTWEEFINSIPFSYSVIQLCTTQFTRFNPKMHKRQSTDYSASIYILKRKHAEAIIERMMRKDKYFIDGKRNNSVADHSVIFGHTNEAFACSLFVYKINMESDLNPQGFVLHKKSRDVALNFWVDKKIKLLDFISLS